MELTASILKKIQTHKRLKERFLIGQNRTKHANFQGSPLFQAMCNIKTINSTCVSWMREAGKRKMARD